MRSLFMVLVLGAAACGGESPIKPGPVTNDGKAGSGSVGGSEQSGTGGSNTGVGASGGRTSGSGTSDGQAGDEASEGGASQAGTDSGGADSGFGGAGMAEGGAAGETSGTATPVKKAPGDAVFEDGPALEFRIRLSDADWTYLEAHGIEEKYVEASAVVTGEGLPETMFGQVGFRHKGAYSLERCWDNPEGVREDTQECKKLSYKVKFDEYLSDARLDGLKRINLHASSGDPTKLRELLGYDTFRAFGVEAPRARPAKLFINDIFQGLFIAVEDVDGRYTKAHYPEGPDGNLFKEIWPNPEVSAEDYRAALETNEEEGDVSDMLAFAQAVGATSRGSFERDMRSWVNLEEVLRYVAVDRALKNWDGIMAFYSPAKPHNFFWYHEDGPEGLFHLVPWDMDNALWEFDPYMHPEQFVTADPIPDWNVRPRHCSPRSVWQLAGSLKVTPPRCDKFLNLLAETQWSRFEQLGYELLNGPFALAHMQARLAHWLKEIEPIIAEDPAVDFEDWQQAVAEFPSILEKAVDDFSGFLGQGLIDEPAPPPEPTEEELNELTQDSGVLLSAVTNYEFVAAPTTGVPAGVSLFLDERSSASARWNTENPLSGAADLRLDFTFKRSPGGWNEYIDMHLRSSEVVDVSGYTRVLMKLSADKVRNIRVRPESPVYSEEFGGAWTEFGVDITITPEPRIYAIRLNSLPYADWARDNWQAGQGWTVSDEEALAMVLKRCSGLMLSPLSTTDAQGELRTESESGYVQIDNIYFQ